MNYNLEIQKLRLKVKTTKHPEDRINLLKQAIQIADANSDLDWGFDLRLDLIRQEIDTSHCVESFLAFTWILNTSYSNPEMFNESDFLWQYKWMANASYRNSHISKEQIESILDNMRMRMEKNGYTLRGYYIIMAYWFMHQGDLAKAEEFLEERDKTSRDQMSHCQACELDTDVEIQLRKGLFDKAIATADDLITKKLTCGVMPLVTFCNLTHYLGEADHPRAKEFFEKAEEEFRLLDENDSSRLSNIADLLLYLTKANKNKAWEYFQKYADWEIGADDLISYDFSKNILPLLKEGGRRKLDVSSKQPYYATDGDYNLDDLYSYYLTKATNIGRQFDERNGNNYYILQLKEMTQRA